MTFPKDLRIVDTFLGLPRAEQPRVYDFMKPLFKDAASKDEFEFPAQYMFKGVPKVTNVDDYVAYVLDLMDRFHIEYALLGWDPSDPNTIRAIEKHPDRFLAEYFVEPNRGMDAVRELTALARNVPLAAVGAFPAGMVPQAPAGDAKWYPVYAKCVELELPFFCCLGVPGPRVPMAPQFVRAIDEVLCFFPELTFVMRHGGEPWIDETVMLLRKHPNLFYSTSAFAPKHYPKGILEYANADGADKVLYAGYFPAGLTLDRIFAELPNVPLRAEVWPKFLRENARRVLRLPAREARLAASRSGGSNEQSACEVQRCGS